ncbi:enoyl-CoA hydratase/isomerase family protein [Pseudomonas haemolytica]|uniref:Enoyl-CoA hydratase/isomerase family protein n=1 Tax=Pseudomonas haemolytica TaxID=2600065 RepID=A0A5P1D9U5_9PSED|nr:enoyl-CoA hydratase-related protein [Pseudomonas haemolytica]MBJ2246927.1 enoyl-CoA hydratase/isomerase family protein [Pseudomonas haemolytica]MBJ2272788.1 enoyl-CoA hydratase/isomerase family protein [Pseudomonas haemolytica]MBK3447098.1 enoyl-CoA hydratase/isomerase family protein [Pseudomonas haemolytica]MBK3458594.1 enoyl-CoA hydratase/isomerase family protein [Pseudomonas haemolytica]MRJ37251.1 enoyl-CoA hydratase/isomerase family protein [Pseudomonas haemolytica]
MNTLLLEAHNGVLHITLNRPECRNAMSLEMVKELREVLAQLDSQVRAVVISGAGGHFCAGADVKDLIGAGNQMQALNRAFGTLLQEVEALPQVVIVLLQGAVLGGGFGLACVSDIAIADHKAQFGLPETRLGLLPAQIAPFVVKRIGLTQARRLALTAARFDGVEAERLGVVHFVEHDPQALAQRLDEVLGQVLQCAPGANARTKSLLLASVNEPLGAVLDRGAQWFAEAVTSEEGIEGTQAFVQKRMPRWCE